MADNFGGECREAFLDHCQTLARINPAEMGRRKANATRRREVIDYIDYILDTYLEWRTVEPWDFPTPTDIPTDVHISLGTD